MSFSAAGLADTLERCSAEGTDLPDLGPPRRLFTLTGGFPELLVAPSLPDEESALIRSQRTLRSDAVERAVYKDIPQAFGVDNPMMLERLLYVLAGQFTGILSPSNICQSLEGLSQATFDRYLSYLTEAYLVFTLQNYSGSEETRQRRGRKLYFVDGAVRNAALQRGAGPLEDGKEMGHLIENLVAGHLHALGQQSQVRLYYWKERREEVDLIYDHPTAPLAFEVGSSASHSRAALGRFQERFPRFENRCYLVAPRAPLLRPSEASGGIGTVPLELLLLAVGRQAEQKLRERIAVE